MYFYICGVFMTSFNLLLSCRAVDKFIKKFISEIERGKIFASLKLEKARWQSHKILVKTLLFEMY